MTEISINLNEVTQQIRAHESKYNRPQNSVTLLAVSKSQPLEKIQQAITAGQKSFGENYLQEALEKITQLNNPQLEWHFIGPIQSNKTKKIAEHFQWVHSIENFNTAKRLNDQRPSHLPPLNICIQVNISEEITKSGVQPDDVIKLAIACLEFPRLTLRGLMTLPAATDNFQQQRTAFQKVRLLQENLRKKGFTLDTLSMGMSHDMEASTAEGATMVRIGTKIFGKRQKI